MSDKVKTVDRRVIRTKKAIREAFAKLLTEKDINDITISDIAELADINRKTFYNYYDGIYQVVDEIENEIIGRFDAVLGEVDFRRDMENPYIIFEKLAAVINMDMDFYVQLLQMRGSQSLVTKIVEMLKQKTKALLIEQVNFDEQKVDIMLNYAFSGMIAVYQNWLSTDRRQSIEEISGIVSTMCLNGFNGLVGEV